jgi:CDP-paratose 2-epimerase
MYFTEYGRPEFGMATCSLRQSCIYGHQQFGVEDQGWVAWFSIANLLGRDVMVYGDGHQVRDLLFVEDLVNLYLLLWERRLTGVYPVGGGEANAISVAQGLDKIAAITGRPFKSLGHEEARPGDQPYFVADLSWVGRLGLAWSPKIGVDEGLRAMIDWQRGHLEEIRAAFAS